MMATKNPIGLSQSNGNLFWSKKNNGNGNISLFLRKFGIDHDKLPQRNWQLKRITSRIGDEINAIAANKFR